MELEINNMPLNKQSNEGNWYYYSPEPINKERIDSPLKSQIPLLNSLPPDDSNAPKKRYMISENDTPYIRLAKQRGRANLLNHSSPPPKAKGPAPYRQCSWFYLEDNAIRDAKTPRDDNSQMNKNKQKTNEMKRHSMDTKTLGVTQNASSEMFRIMSMEYKTPHSMEHEKPKEIISIEKTSTENAAMDRMKNRSFSNNYDFRKKVAVHV